MPRGCLAAAEQLPATLGFYVTRLGRARRELEPKHRESDGLLWSSLQMLLLLLSSRKLQTR